MCAAYVKYNDFVEQLCKGIHHLHAAGDDVKVVIHSDAPTEPTDVSLSNLTQVTGTGYTAGGIDIVNDITESPAGTANLTSGLASTDAVWTGGAGGFTAGQYVSIYNDTATSPADALIASWNYGSSFTVAVGETFTVDFGATIFSIV